MIMPIKFGFWRSLFFMFCIFTLIWLIASPIALAQNLSDDDKKSIYNDTVWYQQSGGAICSTGVDLNLSGNDRAQKAYNFFISKGLTPIQSAAILGNFMRESGIVPTRVQGGGESNTVPLDGKTGYGLAQWTDLGRQQALVDYSKQLNIPVYTLELQLNFVWHEASSGNVINNLKTISSIEKATKYWMDSYERPAAETAALDKRIEFAKQFLEQFGGTGGQGVSATGTSPSCASAGPGQNTKYIDGFIIYSQYDPTWANKPYGTSTIALSGCGPSAMAMIITSLTGRSVTPDVTAAYATSQNLYVQNVGSKWDIGKVLAEHWGLKATKIGIDETTINQVLISGGLVITAGKGSLPFTTGGHFIAIRGVTTTGKWKIGDSGHNNTSGQEWDPQSILSNMSEGSVYAISQ
jgi:hypothetical protein